MSEPADITAPKDPAAYRPRPLLGVTFWAMLALCVLCVIAGIAVATILPRVWSAKPAAHPAETAAPAPPASASSSSAALAPLPPAPEAAPVASPDLARLSARVGILESRQAHVTQAAAGALAAAAVAEASQGSGPFADEVASLAAAAP